MDTTTQTTESGPALSLDWRPFFGDPSVLVAQRTTARDDALHRFGMACQVVVRWDGQGRYLINGTSLPWVQMGHDLASGQVEAERRLRLLVEVMTGVEG